jgi:hemin uptake protein HemP
LSNTLDFPSPHIDNENRSYLGSTGPMPTLPPVLAKNPGPQENVPCIKSTELMRDQRMIAIDHGGQRYTLRVTRENKLILTK